MQEETGTKKGRFFLFSQNAFLLFSNSCCCCCSEFVFLFALFCSVLSPQATSTIQATYPGTLHSLGAAEQRSFAEQVKRGVLRNASSAIGESDIVDVVLSPGSILASVALAPSVSSKAMSMAAAA